MGTCGSYRLSASPSLLSKWTPSSASYSELRQAFVVSEDSVPAQLQ